MRVHICIRVTLRVSYIFSRVSCTRPVVRIFAVTVWAVIKKYRWNASGGGGGWLSTCLVFMYHAVSLYLMAYRVSV